RVKVSLRSITRFQSTFTPPTSMPNLPAWRISFSTSELRTRTFLGLHPFSEHRPPMLPRSMRATRCPAAAMREVAPRPALPPPMATKSYFMRALRSDDSQWRVQEYRDEQTMLHFSLLTNKFHAHLDSRHTANV